LMELLRYSPPDILSMSWYERVRPYAAGTIAMAYGYTLLAPYFELDPLSPAASQTGYLPHPAGPGASPVAPVGGYVMGIPANLAPERIAAAVEALLVFTSLRRKSFMCKMAAGPTRAIQWAPIPRCAAPRPYSRRWTRCPGAMSCSSGRARRCPPSATSSRSAAKSSTTCCGAFAAPPKRCGGPRQGPKPRCDLSQFRDLRRRTTWTPNACKARIS